MSKDFKDLPKIVAVDFDGTLVTDRYPEIGEPNEELFAILKSLRQNCGVKIVLWTCRNFTKKHGDMLEDAIEFCKERGLEFDAINENIQEVQELTGEDTRKVYADLYLDDKSVLPDTLVVRWLDKLGASWYDVMRANGSSSILGAE